MTADQTWIISDIDGSNKRRVTLVQYRAEVDAAKVKAEAIFAAAKVAAKWTPESARRRVGGTFGT